MKKEKIYRGSGNVFKDIGCKNPDELLKQAKKHLKYIKKNIGIMKKEEKKFSEVIKSRSRS